MSEKQFRIIHEGRHDRMLMIESNLLRDLPRILENDEKKEELEKGLMAKFRDSETVDSALDFLSGMGLAASATGAAETATGLGATIGIPSMTIGTAISFVADIVNSFRRAARGEYFGAAIYLMFAIPVAGDLLQGVSWLGKSGKATLASMKPVLAWMRETSNSSKKEKVGKAALQIVDLASKKLPGASEHKAEMKKALDAVISGDMDAVRKAAGEIGENALADEIKKRGEKKDDKESISESRLLEIISDEINEAKREKGKSVMKKAGKKASAGSVAIFKKAASKKKGGEAKKKRAGFDAVKKSAEKWADDPEAVAQATTMVATGEPVVAKGEKRKLKEALDLYQDLLENLDVKYIEMLERRDPR